MSVQNASIPVGATVSSSGGTERVFVVTGKKVNNGIHLIDQSATSGASAAHAYAVSREAQVVANGDFGLGQRSIRFVCPILTSKGNYAYPSAELILRPHPENTTAQLNELINCVVLAGIDADFTSLFQVGSLS